MDGFFPEGTFYAAVAFTSDTRRGNPTGVVFAHAEWTESTCQRIAAELGFPDTAFLTPRPGGWNVRFFSPAEPLSLCVQALIACGSVLARHGGEVALFTPTGEVRVRGEESHFWAEFPAERVTVGSPKVALDRLGTALPGKAPGLVVDSGRVRLFREVADRAALEAVAIAPSDVMDACRNTGLQGLCFWTRIEDRTVGLRVFTPSLDGGEDASTGGAVLGMSTFLGPGSWRVEQGAGPFHRKGELQLRSGERLEVGGAARVVGSGTLADL